MSQSAILDRLVKNVAVTYCTDRKVDQANLLLKKLEGEQRDRVVHLLCQVFDHDYDETNGEFFGECQGYEDAPDKMRDFLADNGGWFSQWERQNYDAPTTTADHIVAALNA